MPVPGHAPKLMRIFNEAAELRSDVERAAYLDEVCGGDQALRDRVEGLLKANEQVDDFLESPAQPPTVEPALGDRSRAEPPGAVVGPYTLLEQIGEGGMGVVYVAEQTRPVRRRVALKVIKPGMDSKQVLARFEAERQALAMMDHPNIARVHEAGATDSGRPYFVMELIHGLPITDYCDRERFSVRERLELFVLVCRAVQHAHQKGIIHRDLKPSNVMVTVVDGVAVPKVIDFGVAKATCGGLTDRTLFTGAHQLVGTPLYMSPEQSDAASADVDTRSDVYSLGVLLYELLTGATPFDAETLRSATFDEMRRILREQEPPAPSSRLLGKTEALTTVSTNRKTDPRQLNRDVRGELDWVVMKSLEKDRTRRYGSAKDFADDVTRYLTNQPVEACPPSRLYHLQKFARRNRARIAALGLIGALGLALAVAVGWQTVERATRRAETASAATQALVEAERLAQSSKWPDAMAAVNQAYALLGASDGNVALRRRSRKLKADLAMVLRLDEVRQEMSAVKDDHFDTRLGDRLYGEAFRDYGIDVESLEPEDIAKRMPVGPVREELVAALDDWTRIRREKHKGDETNWKPLLAAASAADPDPWRNRVREAWLRGDRKALSDLASSAPLDRLHPCGVLLLQASLDNVQAVDVLREAQQRRPGDFWLNHALGMRLHEMQPPRNDEAIGYLRTASALRPESPGAILNVGHVLDMADRTDEAIAAYEQAIRLKPDYAMAYTNLAASLSGLGRFDEAIIASREAIRLKPESSAAHCNLGRALTQIGELDEAIAVLREAIRLEPGGSLAPYNLAIAYCKKVGAGFRHIQEHLNESIVRLKNQHHFPQPLLEPGSPPMLRRYFVLNLLASSLLASPAFAAPPPRYAYTSFDVPGSTTTRGFDINNAGTIVGDFSDPNGAWHGFFRIGGAFNQVDVPNSASTGFWAINAAGVGVGRYDYPLNRGHGFVFDGADFVPIDVPDSTLTVTRGINSTGNIVGFYTDAAGRSHGFLQSGGQITTIDYPNSSFTACSGINDNGQIVGAYDDAAGKKHGFLLSGGRFTAINYPNSTSTIAFKLNFAGQVVGNYKSADGKTHGFLLSGGTYTAINFPNAADTSAVGINDAGVIVGEWIDAGRKSHGFYAVKR